MSDPIAENLYMLGHWKDRKIVDRLAKQIRQMIGRELLAVAFQDLSPTYLVTAEQIRKVCKLEKDNG